VEENPNAPALKMTDQDLGEMYEQYRPELRRFFARRSRSAQNAEDLVQEIYVQLLRFPPTETLRRPQDYLYKIAWRVVNRANQRAHLDEHQMVTADSDTLEWLSAQSATPWAPDISEQLGTREQLQRLLAQLPSAWQVAVVLLRRDGFSYEEIASVMGVSIHTVKKYIAHALAHFKTASRDQ
jgi:RNA polymerase sigma factor (sigma-70 family)